MHITRKSHVSPTVVSVALTGLSVLWFGSAYASFVAGRNSKDILFESAPLWALLFLALVPLSTLILAPWLVRARRLDGRRLTGFDYWALAAGAAPFAFVVILLLVFVVTR